MNLRQMEAFIEVAEAGSFSRAAKKLYLTQPTVSAHISSLERELGARLFVRNTKEVNLSEDGQMLYKYARQIVDLERQIEATFGGRQEPGEKCITIAASTVPAQYLLPKILARFHEKYPGEQLKIMETDSAGVVERVVEHTADVGLTGTVMERKHCKYIPFYKDELVIITPDSEKYQMYSMNPENISWIQREPFIMREEGSGTRKEAEKMLKRAGIETSKLRIIASIENQETIKKLVGRGMGVSVLSRLAAEDEPQGGRILAFPILGTDNGRQICVAYNKNFQPSPSVRRFLRTVKEVYQEESG